MTRAELENLLSDYARGALTPEQAAAVKSFIESRPESAEELRQIGEVVRLIGEELPPAPTEHSMQTAANAVMLTLEQRRRSPASASREQVPVRRPSFMWAPAIAAAIAIAVAAVLFRDGQTPAFAEVIENLKKVESLHLAGWIRGEHGERVAYGQWLQAPDRVRAVVGTGSDSTVVVLNGSLRQIATAEGSVFRERRKGSTSFILDIAISSLYTQSAHDRGDAYRVTSEAYDGGARFTVVLKSSLGSGPSSTRQIVDVPRDEQLPDRIVVEELVAGEWIAISDMQYTYGDPLDLSLFAIDGGVSSRSLSDTDVQRFWFERSLTPLSALIPAAYVPPGGIAVTRIDTTTVDPTKGSGWSKGARGGMVLHELYRVALSRVIHETTGLGTEAGGIGEDEHAVLVRYKRGTPHVEILRALGAHIGFDWELSEAAGERTRYVVSQDGSDFAKSTSDESRSSISTGFSFSKTPLRSVIHNLFLNSDMGFDRTVDRIDYRWNGEDEANPFEEVVDLEVEKRPESWSENKGLLEDHFGVVISEVKEQFSYPVVLPRRSQPPPSEPLPQPQRDVDMERVAVTDTELETGLYGSSDKPTSSPTAVAIDFRKSMLARYVRVEKTGDLEFVELEAYGGSKTNVALGKPVGVSSSIWGDGSRGNDGSHADGGVHPIVMMRDPGANWWEVDLGTETSLTHVVITMREYRMTGGYRSLNGATFSILDGDRNSVASCQLEVGVADEKLTIPMDRAYFHQRDIATRFGVKSVSPRNIIASDNGQLQLVVPDPGALANGKVTLADLEMRNLLTIALSRGTGDYTIPLPGKGHYSISATATYDDGLVVSKKTSAAVVGDLLDSQTRLHSIFGVQGKGRELIELGAAWSWAQIMTHHFSRSDSGFDWGPQMALRMKNGKLDLSPEINWVVMFTYLPEYLQSVPPDQRGHSPTSAPNDYEEFTRLIRWATAMIPDFAKCVAPIPEPSHSFKGSAEELARYHEVVAKTIREVRPDVRIIGPMMSPGNNASLESIRVLDELGMFSHMDGISINPYVVKPFRSRMPEADFIEFVDAVIAHFAATGRPDYPVYLTEFGFGFDPDNPEELTQARHSSRAAILLAARPTIKLANFFLLGGDGWGYSYFDSDGTPRPVYPAMAQAFRWLSDCSPVASTRLAPTMYLAAFEKDGAAGLAIWDTTRESTLEVPIRSILSIQDMMGRNVASIDDRLRISQSPLYLTMADASILSCLSATTAPGKEFTPSQSADIGALEEVIIPEGLLRRGTVVTAAANAEPGEYRLLGKANGTWRVVTLRVDKD